MSATWQEIVTNCTLCFTPECKSNIYPHLFISVYFVYQVGLVSCTWSLMNISSKLPAAVDFYSKNNKKGYEFAVLMIILLPPLTVIPHQEKPACELILAKHYNRQWWHRDRLGVVPDPIQDDPLVTNSWQWEFCWWPQLLLLFLP